jgi:hypothetical protein
LSQVKRIEEVGVELIEGTINQLVPENQINLGL